MNQEFFSLQEAENLLNIPRATLRRWCEEGEIAGIQESKKTRVRWVIPSTEIERLQTKSLQNTQGNQYQALIDQWKREQENGYHTGKPLSPRTIQGNEYGLDKYWQYLRGKTIKKTLIGKDDKGNAIEKPCVIDLLTGQTIVQNALRSDLDALLSPNMEEINPTNLRRALSQVPFDRSAKNGHDSQRNLIYCGIISFYKLLVRERLKPEDELKQLYDPDLKPKTLGLKRRTWVDEQEFITLLVVNKSWKNGRNDFDILLTETLIIFYGLSGLRRNEAIHLNLSDIDLKNEIINVWGKGGKSRSVGINPLLKDQIKKYLKERPDSKSSIFLLQETGKPLTDRIVNRRIKNIADHANIDITPHGLRRAYANFLKNNNTSAFEIKNLLGHTRIEVTDKCYLMEDKKLALRASRSLTININQQDEQASAEKQQTSTIARTKKVSDRKRWN